MDRKEQRGFGQTLRADLRAKKKELSLSDLQVAEQAGMTKEAITAIVQGWTRYPSRRTVEHISNAFGFNPADYGYPPKAAPRLREMEAFPRSSIARRVERLRDKAGGFEKDMYGDYDHNRAWMVPRTSEPEAYLTIREGNGINTVIELSGGKLDAVLKVLELGDYPRLRSTQQVVAYDDGETKVAPVVRQPPAFYTVKEVAELLQVSDGSIRNMIRDGGIKAIKIGSRLRVTRSQMQELFGMDFDGR